MGFNSGFKGLKCHYPPSMIKSQHIINYCNKIFKSKLEIQILMQYLYDMFQKVNNEQLLDLEPNS